MQLIVKIVLVGLFLLTADLCAQSDKENTYEIGDVEVDFLFSYYEQEGENSAVQGGIGDQHLTDFVSGVVVNVPIGDRYIINLKMSADAYTSASTNRIDDPTNPLSSSYQADVISSASYKDTRTYGNLNVSKLFSEYNSLQAGLGFSTEFDVNSFSYNLGWSLQSQSKNTSLQVNTSGIFDTWDLIYPVELRTRAESNPDQFLSTDKRRSFNGSIVLSQVFTKRMQASVVYDITHQSGLLSTPFHRVYFEDGFPLDYLFKSVDIERLPDARIKHAIGLRTNIFPSNFIIARTFLRYYFDSFGVSAYTAELELPIKFSRFISVYPFYRYSKQSESNFFAPFGEHVWDNDSGSGKEEFYTSDYDLSAFSSNKYGLGFRISPAFGIAKSKEIPIIKRSFVFKSIDFRGGMYSRSNGLESFFGAVNVSFLF